MLVDHDRLLLALKRELLAKPSWGQRELLGLLARLEAENAVEENESDLLWRRFAVELEDLFFDRIQRGREAANDRLAGVVAVPRTPHHDETPEEAPWKRQPQPPEGPSPRSSPNRARLSAVARS